MSMQIMENSSGEKPRTLFRTPDHSAYAEEQQNKERILRAAAVLFADKGYAGTAVREIVEAAGVTKPTLYYYFKNKEELYVKLMDEAADTFSQLVERAMARPGRMRQRLQGLFTDIYDLFRSNVGLLRLVNQMIFGPPGSVPAYDLKTRHEQLENSVLEMLHAGVAEGELRGENVEEVRFLLFGVLRSMQCILVMEPMCCHPVLTPGQVGRILDTIFDGARAELREREEDA